MAFDGGWSGGFDGGWDGGAAAPPVSPIGPTGTLIPWMPEAGFRRTLSWETPIHKAYDGKERRVSLKPFPREAFEAEFILTDNEGRLLRARLFEDPSAVYMLPDRDQGVLGTNDLAIGGALITASTTLLDWAFAGQRVLVEHDDGRQHVTHINSAGVGTITLNDVLGGAGGTWLANRYRVHPLIPVRLLDGQPTGFYTTNAAIWRMQALSILPPTVMGTGAPALTTFDGYTVLTELPIVDDDQAPEQHQAAIDFIDYGAAIAVATGRARSDIQRQHSYCHETPSERQWWRLFLSTVRGRQIVFLLPTWLDDLVVASQPVGDGFLRVWADDDRGNFVRDWQASTAHDWLQIELTDGTIAYRKIVAAVDNLDGTDTLTLNAALDTSGAAPDIVRISYLELARLADDMVSISHYQTYSELGLTMLVVQQ